MFTREFLLKQNVNVRICELPIYTSTVDSFQYVLFPPQYIQLITNGSYVSAREGGLWPYCRLIFSNHSTDYAVCK